jgi:fructoselysine-6-phosphate deglycase
MFNFDEKRFVTIQSGAVAMAAEIDEVIAGCVARGARNIFFLGTGGAGILMLPAVRLVEGHTSFPVFCPAPAELILDGHAHLGEGSIVVIPSLSGTTKESIEALAYCRDRGAFVIAFTGHADTPIAQDADHAFVNFGEDDTSSESFYLQSLLVAASIAKAVDGYPDYGQVVAEIQTLPRLLVGVKEQFEERADHWADVIKGSDYHVISGSGSTWAEAFYYGMCILEEMQWIRTRPIHGADFFHGTLELVEGEVSVIILKGEDATRPVMDRVEKFAERYSTIVNVIDAADADLPGISSVTRELISPVILATILERVSAHLEFKRDHPLTTRRYYKRVQY